MCRLRNRSSHLREITDADIPALFAVRIATHENRLSREELTTLGITEETVHARIHGTFKGWLCEVGGKTVGFAMGDRATGELWVIAVLPEYIGQGLGSALLQIVERWLRAEGCTQLWLATDVDTKRKAYSFYRAHGWQDDRIADGMRYMVKEVGEEPNHQLPH